MSGLLYLLSAVPEGRLFAFDQQMFISVAIQLFNATLLAVVLSFLLYKPVSRFLRKRSDGIKNDIEKAAEAMAKALETKESYERKIRIIEHERIEILDAAQVVAAEKSKLLLDEAKIEIEAARARADAEIQKDRERAAEEFKLHVIEVSNIIAEKFISQSVDAETGERLFEETMSELEGAAWPD